MAFDPIIFTAEIALKLVPREHLPLVAQDALMAGFDGPRVIRMAILESTDIWAINEALPPMLAELGCHAVSLERAATLLAHRRARLILDGGEDPLPSLPYFDRLFHAADRPDQLQRLAYIEEEYDPDWGPSEQRAWAEDALRELLAST